MFSESAMYHRHSQESPESLHPEARWRKRAVVTHTIVDIEEEHGLLILCRHLVDVVDCGQGSVKGGLWEGAVQTRLVRRGSPVAQDAWMVFLLAEPAWHSPSPPHADRNSTACIASIRISRLLIALVLCVLGIDF